MGAKVAESDTVNDDELETAAMPDGDKDVREGDAGAWEALSGSGAIANKYFTGGEGKR